MGVDMHFFVESDRHGSWDAEAEFFLYGSPELMSLISPYGIRGGDTSGYSSSGFPKDVSRKVVDKWGTWDIDKAGYPSNWGTIEPLKDSYLGKVYPYFGTFGEGWMTTYEFEQILGLYEESYSDGEGIPVMYFCVYEYMKSVEAKGFSCRAVFFFDN